MCSDARALAVFVALASALGGCGASQSACVVDEERIAQRVAELLEEHASEPAEGNDDDSEDDGEAAGGVPRGARQPVAAAPFSDPPPVPRPSGDPSPLARARPTEPPARVWIAPGRSPSRGPDGALVTVIVFTDFQCPYCSRAAETVEALRARYPDELRVVFKHFPLPMHPHAMPASEAAVEAFVQGGEDGFWRMHDRLFATQRGLSLDDLVDDASALGLDSGRLGAAVEAQVHAPAIEADIALGTASGVTGTPTFFLNGTRLVGAPRLEAFAAAVDAELVVARAELARGTPRSRIYETIANGAPRRSGGAR